MDRRSHYMQIALELFAKHGYHGVSTNQIVEAAGGSKETLYRYFESKDSLFAAIIDDLQNRLALVPDTLDYVDLPLEEGLRILGHATAQAALSERAMVLLRLACSEYSRFPKLAQMLFEQAPARSNARFREFLRTKQQRGEIEIDDLQIGAEQFLSGLVGHQQLRMLLGVSKKPSQRAIDKRVEAAVAMFVRTYGSGS